MERVTFDGEKFATLIIRAMGDRNASTFSKVSNLSKNQIGLWIRQKTYFTPKKETLRKIATNAQNGVTYEELLDACGYLPSPKNSWKNPCFNLFEIKYIVRDYLPNASSKQVDCITDQVVRHMELTLFSEIRKEVAEIKNRKDLIV